MTAEATVAAPEISDADARRGFFYALSATCCGAGCRST